MNKKINQFMNEMVKIPAGTIHLRDDRTKKKWEAAVEEFLITPFLITQEIYCSFMDKNPSKLKSSNCPVESVSWLDAVLFCNKFSELAGLESCYIFSNDNMGAELQVSANGFHLPSEAQWEYACRAGTTSSRYSDIEKIAWYEANSLGSVQPVGMKEPNAWGLYDMLGNAWEWCSDLYDPIDYGEYRIFRGGGWADKERGILASNRRRSHPTFKIDDLSFRIVRSTF